MTLFINGNNLNNPFWGVSRVAFELVRSLDRIFAEPGKMNPFDDVVLLGRTPTSPIPSLKAIRYERIRAPSLYLWENVALALRTKGHPIVGFQNRNPLFKRNCATMIHGLQVLTQPSSYSLRARWEGRLLLPIIGRLHRTILTVSRFSADEIAALGVAKRDKIDVVYNGIDHCEVRSGGTAKAAIDPPLPPRGYVLAQASVKPHKNIGILLQAFADPALADLTLVLFGGDDRAAFAAAGHSIPSNVVFAGLIGDSALADLLRNALCLAFPSLTEGFGLPPLEAMMAGTPAVVSDRGAIPEICGGGAAMMCDPTDATAWRDAIAELARNEELRARHVALGKARAETFTWERAGRSLYDILVARHGV
ncbi:glycosyltransferase family 1 protein [uncultured Sphingomonas sp.]|uniref:glycosyltransferase family 4 protein n=1 Tax=unclassified Sphingomonas TaxID=196159 RepID=UPI0025F02091|nr:glycosyltransferase family 1 protein [uncultured Sphingomonas sp.]